MIEGLSMDTADYQVAERATVQHKEALSRALTAMEGVETAEVNDNTVFVQYYPEILSRESIRRELVRLGVSLEKHRKPNNPFKRFVDRLGESNTKTFGSEPLDCCKLNKNERPGP